MIEVKKQNIDNIDNVIKKMYNTVIENKNYEDYINLISKKYHIKKSDLKKELNNYAKTKDNYKLYKENLKIVQKTNQYADLKYYFDLYIISNINDKNINNISNRKISKIKIKKYATEYYEKYATQEEKNKYELITENKKEYIDIKLNNLFEQVLTSDINNALELYKENNIKNLDELIKKYIEFLKNYSKLNSEQIRLTKEKLYKTKKLYNEEINREKELNRQEKKRNEMVKKITLLPKAETFLVQIINSDVNNINSILKDHNLDNKDLKQYVNIVKELNPELYKSYQEKEQKIVLEKYNDLLLKINEVTEILQKEIIDNDKKFNILNYYQKIKVDLDKLLKMLKGKIPNEKYTLLYNFYEDNKLLNKITSKEILSKEIIIKNKVINKTQKQKIINYIKDNKLPMYEEIFMIIGNDKEEVYGNRKSKKVF